MATGRCAGSAKYSVPAIRRLQLGRELQAWREKAGLTLEQASGHENTACVEVAFSSPAVAVRGSKDPSGPHLTVAPPAWLGLLASVTPTG